MSGDARKVNHPPIIDAMVLVRFAKVFSDEEKGQITASLSKLGYVEDEDPIHSEFQAKWFSSEDQERDIILRNETLIYRDGRKYKTRDILIENFKPIWDICELGRRIDYLNSVRLRVVNKFNARTTDIGQAIKIRPFIYLEHGPGQHGPMLMGASNMTLDIRSEYRKANAEIIWDMKPISEEQVEIIFDIDTYVENETFVDFDSFVTCLNNLSDFKNDIFFANISDAKERFSK